LGSAGDPGFELLFFAEAAKARLEKEEQFKPWVTR